MAETLGSLVDKITIKEIRKYHLQEMLKLKDVEFSAGAINAKITLLNKQIKTMGNEIDGFIMLALKGKIHLRDEKLKIYNALGDMNKIPQFTSLGAAISGLAQKNLELWHLEDEARRRDVTLEYIGRIKKKIDFANQQRNDLIDKIDSLLEGLAKERPAK
jgi:hypothetical protein